MYEGCEKRLDVYFVCADANAAGLCELPFALWERVARAAGAEVLSQVRAARVHASSLFAETRPKRAFGGFDQPTPCVPAL